MTVYRSAFGDLLEEKFRKVAFNAYSMDADEYSKCFDVKSSQKDNEHVSEISGLPIAQTKTEGSDMGYEDPKQLYDKTYTHTTFAQGLRLSMESMDDDQYGILGGKMFNSQGRGFKARVETDSCNILNNGFANTGPDGATLFSVTHPQNPDETTTYHLNRPSTDADLAVASLKAAMINFKNTKDERGLRIAINPKKLVVPIDLMFTAQEILQSTLQPYVADNTTNVLQNSLELVVMKYLTDADAWFVLGDKADHGLCFYWRKKYTVKRDSDFDSWDAKFGGIMRFSVGYDKWRGTYGTEGA